jgi:hypothetical protein
MLQVRFLTKIYHPNIDKVGMHIAYSFVVPVSFLWIVIQRRTLLLQLGRICLDILKDKWSPALQIRTVLLRSLYLSLSVSVPYFMFLPKKTLFLLFKPNKPNLPRGAFSLLFLCSTKIWLYERCSVSMPFVSTDMLAIPWHCSGFQYTGSPECAKSRWPSFR